MKNTDRKRLIRVVYNGSWTQWFDADDPRVKEILLKDGLNICAVQIKESITLVEARQMYSELFR